MTSVDEFTILQSVYMKDKPEYLDDCLNSIFYSTIKPKRIVLIRDGLVSQDIENVISKWSNKLPIFFVGYDENKGLSYALNYGLKYVETELVARMDSDDLVYPDRFEKQLNYYKSHSDICLLSGYIEEFNDNPEKIVSVRTVPLSNNDIKTYLKKRNAFNHMAVMFKKSVIQDVGGYQAVPFFEDYDLWIRIVQKGYKVANIPEKLIKARIGNDMIGRRHGFSYAKDELNFLRRQLATGFITSKEYRKLIFLRIPVRLLPKQGLKMIYKLLRG